MALALLGRRQIEHEEFWALDSVDLTVKQGETVGIIGPNGLIADPLQMLNSVGAIALILAHAYAPFAILPIFVALQTIPGALLEAASDLGASRVQT